ncbi:hypothetical protein [Dinoroseobacter shibae]|jgi:hypothetical protein|uniref:hypothetical protein n=1 Tax=Dinoroseobacter shibae TaxID=215813 RepID=UPI0005C6122C|nr:hypothetical protein [Dinoroseobacter shibae]URF45876.1 hypothetical protein M8008_13995 [Dinoroseobacter shibae]URF50183.1 hypothetical protein M8007_13995 [Dinoroseobacter shibae]
MRYPWIAALCVAGCSQVPLASMVELARFDPLQTDLAGITVAVDVTEGLRVAPDGAIMVLAAQAPSGASVSERFVLDQAAVSETRWFFGVAPQDAARLERARQQIVALKAEDPATAGQLSVTAEPCRAVAGAGGTVDVFLQLAADRPFVPVAPTVDLEDEGVPVPRCEGM